MEVEEGQHGHEGVLVLSDLPEGATGHVAVEGPAAGAVVDGRVTS